MVIGRNASWNSSSDTFDEFLQKETKNLLRIVDRTRSKQKKKKAKTKNATGIRKNK